MAYDHWLAAFLADRRGEFCLLFQTLDLLLGHFDGCHKRLVEIPENLYPFCLAGFDGVESVLHTCGELDIDELRKSLNEEFGHGGTKRGRPESSLLLAHVAPLADSQNYGRIGTGPANSLFLQVSDQCRLGIWWRRFCEVL